MTSVSDHVQLLHRVLSFDIDGDRVGLPFAARLARENGWSRAYADRVVTEYKRFVYLAMTSDTPVCPSEDVDAAWHLHLTYTRSYWKRFCGEVLGRPLHHEPTKGGPAEHEKHLAMYAATLAAYRAAFGSAPPADVWSPSGERFGDDLAHRAVNTARNWVIPKAPVKHAARVAAIAAAVALFVPGCNGGLNPFALKGADFFYFLVPVMLGAAFLGRLIRLKLRGPAPEPGEDDDVELTWEQAAYVAGGYGRLTTAAIARLVGCGAAAVEDTRLVHGGHAQPDPTPVEKAVLEALPFSNDAAAMGPVVRAVQAAFGDEARKLEERGYAMGAVTRMSSRFLGTVPLIIVLMVFCVPRGLLGLAGNKPTEYLLFVGFIGFMACMAIIQAGISPLTRRGEYVLSKLKDRHRTLQTGPLWVGRTSDAGLAVALFGTAALVGSSIAMLGTWYPRQTMASSSGGCGTGCGAGGCGAGGAGCGAGGGGGCGGGGCGGCGGGGGD